MKVYRLDNRRTRWLSSSFRAITFCLLSFPSRDCKQIAGIPSSYNASPVGDRAVMATDEVDF